MTDPLQIWCSYAGKNGGKLSRTWIYLAPKICILGDIHVSREFVCRRNKVYMYAGMYVCMYICMCACVSQDLSKQHMCMCPIYILYMSTVRTNMQTFTNYAREIQATRIRLCIFILKTITEKGMLYKNTHNMSVVCIYVCMYVCMQL